MHYIKAKSIIGVNGGINLYRGCSHGCIYCDSRSECYHIDNYEDIGVKENAIEILENELKNKKPRMLKTGSMSDPYLHLEKDLKLTRSLLELTYKYKCGISLLTKSDLVLRDLDLLEKINAQSKAVVFMTITCFNDLLSNQIEPNVCVSSKRFEALKKIHDKGIDIGIWLCPILPFINDTDENIINIVEKCHEIGIKYIVSFGFGTTMRRGSKEYFFDSLDTLFPNMKERYIKAYGNRYDCPSPRSNHLYSIFDSLCHKYNILYSLNGIDKKIEKEFNDMLDSREITLFNYDK